MQNGCKPQDAFVENIQSQAGPNSHWHGRGEDHDVGRRVAVLDAKSKCGHAPSKRVPALPVIGIFAGNPCLYELGIAGQPAAMDSRRVFPVARVNLLSLSSPRVLVRAKRVLAKNLLPSKSKNKTKAAHRNRKYS